MYTMKSGQNLSIYQGYVPKSKKYQKTELEAYIGYTISKAISENMVRLTKKMAESIVDGVILQRK